MSSFTTPRATGAIDKRIIAAMRLVLATSALLITYIDPSEPDRLIVVTYTTLSLYTIYSAALYLLAAPRTARYLEPVYAWAHWLDVGWYVLLISLSHGTSSIFFFGFFFAMLVASFRWGFASGLRVTVTSVILFTVVGVATAPRGEAFELNRALVRPIYMLVLGYMMAYWGGYEITLKRRLELLREISAMANPRFGVDRTIGMLMERLRAFYNANACLVVSGAEAGGEDRLRRADRHDPERATQVTALPPEIAQHLLALPPHQAAVYNGGWRARLWGSDQKTVDIETGARTSEGGAELAALATTLDATSFVTVPVQYTRNGVDRLYLTSSSRTFDSSDVELLLQVIAQVTPVIENTRLVDRLASDAAEEERRRIARDLHDSVIQPYIGLQLGIAAIRRKVSTGVADLSDDIDQLYRLSNDGIATLRGYVQGLKVGGDRDSSLQAALQRFATRFEASTSIAVEIDAAANVRCNDRLAAEVFQMVAEGLSNIRRHTQSPRAIIRLRRDDKHLTLLLENEGVAGAPPPRFTPRSISERAAALGGSAHVEPRPDNRTAVVVEIPL